MIKRHKTLFRNETNIISNSCQHYLRNSNTELWRNETSHYYQMFVTIDHKPWRDAGGRETVQSKVSSFTFNDLSQCVKPVQKSCVLRSLTSCRHHWQHQRTRQRGWGVWGGRSQWKVYCIKLFVQKSGDWQNNFAHRQTIN